MTNIPDEKSDSPNISETLIENDVDHDIILDIPPGNDDVSIDDWVDCEENLEEAAKNAASNSSETGQKKFVQNMLESYSSIELPRIFFGAIRIFFYVLISGFFAIFCYFFTGNSSVLEIITSVSVFLANVTAYEIVIWFPQKSKFVEVSCEIIIFLLFEIAICLPLTPFLDNFIPRFWIDLKGQLSGAFWNFTLLFYVFIAFTIITNILTHATLILHSIRGTKTIVSKYYAILRAFNIIIAGILIYGTMFLAISLKDRDVLFEIIETQILLFVLTLFGVIFLSRGKECEDIKNYIDLSTNKEKWIGYATTFLLLPAYTSFICFAYSTNYYEKPAPNLNPVFSLAYIITFLFSQNLYLKFRIDPNFKLYCRG